LPRRGGLRPRRSRREDLAPSRSASKEANPELLGIALKLVTGADKTTVMTMLM
jgi:hypothetical protein